MRKCLIVDDNQAFAENLAEILGDAGVETDVVGSGAVATERVKQVRYDVLISDMRMPVMNGAELVHRVRRIDPGLPAIVITAYTNDDDLEAARREGLLAVLPKPAPMARLIELAGAARRDGLVVLVEVDPAMSDNLCEVLRGRGFAAITAASVVETERIGEVQPFSALVDLRLPDGPDGMAMTRLASRFPTLPMLVITAHPDASPPERYVRLFEKPFHTAELLDTVERLYTARRE
jgi:two-component system, response regulator PdtaR